MQLFYDSFKFVFLIISFFEYILLLYSKILIKILYFKTNPILEILILSVFLFLKQEIFIWENYLKK